MFLPGEDPEEFRRQVDRWAAQLGAVTEAEYAQVERAVYHLWKARRAGNASAAAVTRAIKAVENAFYDNQQAQLQMLIDHLPVSPLAVVAQLALGSVGIRWLLSRLEHLAEDLRTFGHLTVPARITFLHLSGMVPTSLFQHEQVMAFQMACLSAECGGRKVSAAGAAELLKDSRPAAMDPADFARQLEPHHATMPPPEVARGLIAHMIRVMQSNLTADLELITARELHELQLRQTEAQCDVTREGSLRERYETTADRQHQASLRTLRGLLDTRRKYGEGDLPEREGSNQQEEQEQPVEGPVNPPPAGPAEGAIPPQGVAVQKEATVTQVSGEDRTCNEGALQSTPGGPVRQGEGSATTSTGAETGHLARAFQPLRE